MKISIVTPCLNAQEFISETIESIISQAGEFEIEYIIIDGNSSDRTVEIAEEYKKRIDLKQYTIQCSKVNIYIYSESDQGMYCALNKGFSRATGDLFAYLNADDVYLPNSLANIIAIFKQYPEIFWLKGITSYIDCHGQLLGRGNFHMYTQKWIKEGKYGKEWYFITQDSVFWRSSLWKKSGGFNEKLKYAGDYDLWIKFADYCPLYLTNFYVSSFRRRKGQLSQNKTYGLEIASITGKTRIIQKIFRKFIQLSPNPIKRKFVNLIYTDELFYIVINQGDKGFSKIEIASRELFDKKLPVVFF
jgi:glycosyltransferase involved in cell wall biosynthesis